MEPCFHSTSKHHLVYNTRGISLPRHISSWNIHSHSSGQARGASSLDQDINTDCCCRCYTPHCTSEIRACRSQSQFRMCGINILHLSCPSQHPTIPSPEQTCSWLSRLVYSFMDPVIIKALRRPNLPYEDLPPLADYDDAEYLTKRSLQVGSCPFRTACIDSVTVQYLDPTIITKRQHVFYALLRIFAREFTIMALLVMLRSVLSFASPIGVKYLLGYAIIKNRFSRLNDMQVSRNWWSGCLF